MGPGGRSRDGGGSARFDRLDVKFDPGLAEVKASITMLKRMNGAVMGGVAALIIQRVFT
jgi:hypothetical protein